MEVEKMSSAENNNKDDIDDEVALPLPGFRFHPTDEELLGFYLRRKVEKKPIRFDLIKQVDIYKYDPWDLPKVSSRMGDKEWYFFCIRTRKYRNSTRPNRVTGTGSGFWKATGIDKPIFSNADTNNCIGLKKSLVYYRGSGGKGLKTDWMMHEFRFPPTLKNDNHPTAKNIPQEAEVWTLCRVLKRNASDKNIADWKENSTKRSPTDVNSKTCSLESADSNEQYMNFTDRLGVQQKPRKPIVDQRIRLFDDQQQNSVAQSPLETSYSGFWNLNGEEFFIDGNWDGMN
ncbi:hypothetical protein F0562_008070 [Nyssa sinensis]|uniref:NAC domain-containing protein n=1 Tax=Nyssa sinensis TaxID=561372 RepID=A0A5J5AA68_9ASTE|nr:hypothetical protein F0562_008070 [Nyssa sinensis]